MLLDIYLQHYLYHILYLSLFVIWICDKYCSFKVSVGTPFTGPGKTLNPGRIRSLNGILIVLAH